jgi:hypothetical protein
MTSARIADPSTAAETWSERTRRRNREELRSHVRLFASLVGGFACLVGAWWAYTWIELPRSRSEGQLFLARTDGLDGYGKSPLVLFEPFDADGDGANEVVVAIEDSAFGGVERFEAFRSDGELVATWSRELHFGSLFGALPWITSAGDVNGDGHGELLVLSSPRRLLTLATGAVRELADPGTTLIGRGAGDLDGDGLADLVMVNDYGGGAVCARAERGVDGVALWSTQLAAALARDTANDVRLARLGDQNSDGAAEFVCLATPLDGTPQLAVLSGRNGAVLRTNAAAAWVEVESAGDVDGDGLDDVLARTSEFAVVLTGGANHEHLRLTPPAGHMTRAVGVGDLDGDDRSELLLLASEYANTATIGRLHRGSDGGLIRELRWASETLWAGASVARAGDLDGDGRGDLLLGAARHYDGDFHLHTARRPRRSWVMAYSGAFLCASSEPLVIR